MSRASDVHTRGHTLVHPAESVIVVGAKYRWSHGTINALLSALFQEDGRLHLERQCAVVIRIRTSPEENTRVAATNQANRHAIRRGRWGQSANSHSRNPSQISSYVIVKDGHIQTSLQTNPPNETIHEPIPSRTVGGRLVAHHEHSIPSAASTMRC